jgi:plastocyanin
LRIGSNQVPAARGFSRALASITRVPVGDAALKSRTAGNLVVILSLALLFASGVPAADPPREVANGAIRGRVELRNAPAEPGRRPNVSDLGMPSVHGSTDRRRSVVYLDPAPQPAFGPREELRARMDQRDETFVPHVLAIVAGTVVDFPNNDQTFHNVFSLSKEQPFDLGRYAAGRSKSVRFDRPGIVRVFCDIHAHMSAFILVFAHRYFAVTDENGRFRIDHVPPGSYNVVAWNDSASEDSRQVVVPDRGGDVELNFVLGRR